MKTQKTITTITAVALLSVAFTSTSHAWFFRTNVNVDTSKTYNTSAGRDMNTNSNNRYNSPTIRGNSNNSNFGTINASASNFSGGNSFGSGRSTFASSHSKLGNIGNNNSGNLGFGSGMNTVSGGGVQMGETHIIGDSAIKAANGQ